MTTGNPCTLWATPRNLWVRSGRIAAYVFWLEYVNEQIVGQGRICLQFPGFVVTAFVVEFSEMQLCRVELRACNRVGILYTFEQTGHQKVLSKQFLSWDKRLRMRYL